MKYLVLLTALLLQAPAPTNLPPAKASIEGIVVDNAIQPVAGAEVRAFWDPMPPTFQPSQVPHAFTDINGRFAVSSLEAGGYRLEVRAAGFVTQIYGASRSGLIASGMATVVVLTPGQNVRGIAVSLKRASTISGRVLSTTGEPLTGMDVFALRLSYDISGWRMLVPETSGAQTDDRGEYRIAGMGPGLYYIRAESPTLPPALRAATGRPPASSGSYTTTYYPGEKLVERAGLVTVREEEEIRGIDFVLSRQQIFRIRGHITDTDGKALSSALPGNNPEEKPPLRPMLGLIPIQAEFLASVSSSILPYCGASPQCLNPTGAFEFTDVAPGLYWVRAQISTPLTPEQRQLLQTPGADPFSLPQPKLAVAVVRVSNSDVDNVELKFFESLSVSGHIRIDDALPASLDGASTVKVGLRLISSTTLGPIRTAVPDSEGRFSFGNLIPADYRVEISNLPQDVFISDARIGGTHVLTEYLRVDAPLSAELDIQLSAKSGRLSGVVQDAKSNVVSKATVVLVPNDVKGRPDLYKTAVSDSDGRFAMTGIAPGDYAAFSWEDVDDYSYFNPSFVRRFEGQAVPVHIKAGSTEELSVSRIRANSN